MDTDVAPLEDALWRRHSNPASGWTRVPMGAVIVYALYRRNWRLLLAALAWTVLNPIVFSPPRSEDAWMTRAVLAERWWVREQDRGTLGIRYPNVCNTVSAVGFLGALFGAWRQRPAIAAVGTLVGSASKLWWIHELVRRYDASAD
jgi:hypothetical protein